VSSGKDFEVAELFVVVRVGGGVEGPAEPVGESGECFASFFLCVVDEDGEGDSDDREGDDEEDDSAGLQIGSPNRGGGGWCGQFFGNTRFWIGISY